MFLSFQVTVGNAVTAIKDHDQEPAEKICLDLSKSIACIEEVSDKTAADKAEGSAESSAASKTTFDSSKSVDMVLPHNLATFPILVQRVKGVIHQTGNFSSHWLSYLLCTGKSKFWVYSKNA